MSNVSKLGNNAAFTILFCTVLLLEFALHFHHGVPSFAAFVPADFVVAAKTDLIA